VDKELDGAEQAALRRGHCPAGTIQQQQYGQYAQHPPERLGEQYEQDVGPGFYGSHQQWQQQEIWQKAVPRRQQQQYQQRQQGRQQPGRYPQGSGCGQFDSSPGWDRSKKWHKGGRGGNGGRQQQQGRGGKGVGKGVQRSKGRGWSHDM
jgi:hypothetical protein